MNFKRAGLHLWHLILVVVTVACGPVEPATERLPSLLDYAWSPDGQYFAYLSEQEGIFRVSALEIATDNTILIDSRPGKGRNLAFDPSGNQLAYLTEGHLKTTISIYDFEHKSVTEITSGLNSIGPLEWSRDGTELLYINGNEIVAYSFLTNEVTSIVSSDRQPLFFVLAPDGTNVAYVLNESIYLVNRLIGDVEKISDAILCVPQIDWIPNSQAVSFVSCSDGWRTLFSIDIKTQEINRLGLERFGAVRAPWSSDGALFLYIGLGENGSFEVFVWNRQSELGAQITDTPQVNVGFPLWSPDGSQIIYLTGEPGKFAVASHMEEVHMIDVDGQNDHLLLSLR